MNSLNYYDVTIKYCIECYIDFRFYLFFMVLRPVVAMRTAVLFYFIISFKIFIY